MRAELRRLVAEVAAPGCGEEVETLMTHRTRQVVAHTAARSLGAERWCFGDGIYRHGRGLLERPLDARAVPHLNDIVSIGVAGEHKASAERKSHCVAASWLDSPKMSGVCYRRTAAPSAARAILREEVRGNSEMMQTRRGTSKPPDAPALRATSSGSATPARGVAFAEQTPGDNGRSYSPRMWRRALSNSAKRKG